MLKQIKELLIKDIRLNWRERYSIYSMILYVVSTSYISYLSFEGIINKNSWIALFWIIVFFSAINACLQSFKRELNHQAIFFFTLADPKAIITSKIIYNSVLLICLNVISYIIYSIFLGNPITEKIPFILCLIFGSATLASILTLIAAISSKTNNSSGLMAILSLPILFPLLINLIKTSQICLVENQYLMISNQILFIILLNITCFILSYLLFPYLWRD